MYGALRGARQEDLENELRSAADKCKHKSSPADSTLCKSNTYFLLSNLLSGHVGDLVDRQPDFGVG